MARRSQDHTPPQARSILEVSWVVRGWQSACHQPPVRFTCQEMRVSTSVTVAMMPVNELPLSQSEEKAFGRLALKAARESDWDTYNTVRKTFLAGADEMLRACGGVWSWARRAIWVTVDGNTYAASMNCMPHNEGGSDSMPYNNFDGCFCIHFLNSRTHEGNRLDAAHQAAVAKALKAGNS